MAKGWTKLTPRVMDDFCAAIKVGATYKIAAAHAGVSLRCIYNWLDLGADEERRLAEDVNAEPDRGRAIFVQFFRKLEAAKAEAALSWLQVIDQAARSDANWALKMLQIRYPGDYTLHHHETLEHVGKDGGPIQIFSLDTWIQERRKRLMEVSEVGEPEDDEEENGECSP